MKTDYFYSKMFDKYMFSVSSIIDCVSLFQTPYLYRGERYRNKMDFSLRMYGDEVKVRSLRI